MQEKVLEHILVKMLMSSGPFPSFAGSPAAVTERQLRYSHSNVQKYLNPEATFALQVEESHQKSFGFTDSPDSSRVERSVLLPPICSDRRKETGRPLTCWAYARLSFPTEVWRRPLNANSAVFTVGRD